MKAARRLLLIWNSLASFINFFKLNLMQRYILRQFITVLLLGLAAAASVFLVFETFERMKVFIREGATLWQIISYLGFKVPLIVHLMAPVAVLVAALISIGRMSQLSEITAMRACGASIASLAKPLLFAGVAISVIMFISGETIVPWATQRTEEIYNLDIRKKDVKGRLSKANIWSREGNKFFSISYYDSRNKTLNGISIFEITPGEFKLSKRIDAPEAAWGNNSLIGWTLKQPSEIAIRTNEKIASTRFNQLPFLVNKKPEAFSNIERTPESLSYQELSEQINKLKSEGVPTTSYDVDLASKIAFPLVNVIVILVAFPFALIPARSGKLGISFIAGICTGFGYYVIHAISTSLGSAELIPIIPAAWTANIILGSFGAYLMIDTEYQ